MAIAPRLRMMLDRLADVQSATYGQDGSGASSPTYATVTSGEPCSVWPVSNEIRDTYQRRDIVVSHQIAFGRDLSLTAKNRIVEGGIYYLVKGVNKFQNTMVVNTTLYVVDVEQRIV